MRVVGSAVPEMNEVDRVVRGVDADQSEGEGDGIGSGFAMDDLQRLQGNLSGDIESRSRRGPEPQRELPGFYRRKDLESESATQEQDRPERGHEVGPDDHPTGPQYDPECGGIAAL